MSSKKILGLDLGTNSIGWALVDMDFENNSGRIDGLGSRIIPMGQEMSKFEQGQAQTKNADRRIARGMRKLNKRYKQRRNKLIYLLQQLDMLPDQFKLSKPFDNPLKLDRVSILPISMNQKQYTALDLLKLRVKALNEPIGLKEMGRIIYLFNQLRGYAGGGNEPESDENSAGDEQEVNQNKNDKRSEVKFGKVLSISTPEVVKFNNKEINKCTVTFETEDEVIIGGTFLDILKEGDSLELMVNVTSSKKHGETVVFKLPNKTSWRKKMENLEKELTSRSYELGREVYLSEYFLEKLQINNFDKIRNNVVLRSRYQTEFDRIWKVQSEHEEGAIFKVAQLLTHDRLAGILEFIFPGTSGTQEKLRIEGLQKGLNHIIRNQIIYYQRELKDQSHLISDCRFEKGEKALAKSHPVFQEFKIWEQINKLTINTKVENGRNRKGEIRYKYLDRPIPVLLKEWLFDELQVKKEIGFSTIFNKLKKDYGLREGEDFLNGMNPKAKFQGNETKQLLQKALGIELWTQLELDDKNRQIELWDILYNAKGNEYDLESDRNKMILQFIKQGKFQIEDHSQKAILISKIRFARNYAALSLKAIEKILPLVRCGKYFTNQFSETLHEKIVKLLNEEVSDPFEKSAQEYLEANLDLLLEGGIMNAYAAILVYDRHTAKEYGANEIIDTYQKIHRLKQGELRNPLVEQLISEALMVVKDIWRIHGKPDEIRLELARELKNNAERRDKIYKQNNANRKANDEVKRFLVELEQEITLANIEKFKLWNSQENSSEEFVKAYNDPTKSQIERMKLWREQGHVSPYTNKPIPLGELFNRERYDVDHIIPQSRYFDDSFNNKVICEKAVNLEKNNRTAMEYFEIGSKNEAVLSKSEFIELVNKKFTGPKRNNLLATKVPEDPVSRQMKETQYISLRVKEELNKIVGNNNVKTTTGGVTDYLRNQWGLTDKFKELVRPRYEKTLPMLAKAEYDDYKSEFAKRKKEHEDMGIPFHEVELTEAQHLRKFSDSFMFRKNNKLIIKGWTKRIDHRHHAMDALVIACTEPAQVKRLNDLNKELQTWLDQHRKEILPNFEGSPNELLDEILNLDEAKRKTIFKQIEKFRAIELPWVGFPEAAEQSLRRMIVSQKLKDKLLIQFEERKAEDGGSQRSDKLQIKLRDQLHESTLYGKTLGVEAYRIPLEKFAGKKFATEKTIEKIVNKDLRDFMKQHLKDFDNKKDEAFSAEGIISLNKKLAEKHDKKNKHKPHKPISSIKVFYRDPTKAKKKTGSEEIEEALQKLDRKRAYNNSLYVKTGGNYLFAVMEKNGKRIFDLISFFDAANLLKENFKNAKNKSELNKDAVFKSYFEDKHKARLLFTLKQGDPVYMPSTNEEVIIDPKSPLYEGFWGDKMERSKKIHYVTKFSGSQIYFIKHDVSIPIVKGQEFGSQNANEFIDDRSIKNHCIKIDIDRLGNVTLSANVRSLESGIGIQGSSDENDDVINYSGSRQIYIGGSSYVEEGEQWSYWASLTPEQRFADFFNLMNRFHQFSLPNWSSKKIIIDK
jgi:CRISPR-associated endonuclease Csn1